MKLACVSMLVGSVGFYGCSNDKTTDKPEAAAEITVKAIDSANFDFNVKPGDNFFEYANGAWLKANPIPDDQSSWGSFNLLREATNTQVREIVENAAKESGEKGSAKQQIGDFFKSGMDTAAINSKGFAPITADIERLNKTANVQEFMENFYYLQSKTITPLFGLYAGQDDKNSSMVIAQLAQGGITLGNKDYYLAQDERSKTIREKYVEHIGKMFALIKQENPEAKAKAIMDFETKLAKISMSNVEQRDPYKVYNKMSIADLKKLTPLVDWDKYFVALGIPEPKEINITSTPFFKGLTKAVQGEKIEVLRDYLVWNLLNESASLLSSDFVNQQFDFWGKTFQGKQKDDERWKKILNAINGSLGEEVGELYVEKYFPPAAKARMEELIKNLRVALDERIQQLDWMGDETKAKAREKLQTISVKVGYPNKWKNYSSLEIVADNYYQNILNASKWNYMDMLKKIDKPYDKEEWHMTPQTVNAYYSPNSNEIVFPAGILQPPFFYQNGDDAVNYGAIGVVIGHEITHGFDDQGKNFDKDGNLTDWWTKDDAKRFAERANVFGAQYVAHKYPQLGENVHINPELTMGENIADLGGVTIAYAAFQKANQPKDAIDGFTPDQRFFLAYAQVWRINTRDEALSSRLKDDPHSPGDARVNVILPNIPQYYTAFDIKEGEKMYRKPEDRVIIW